MLIAISAHATAPDAIGVVVARTHVALGSGSGLIALALVVAVLWIARRPLVAHAEELAEPSLVDLEPLD